MEKNGIGLGKREGKEIMMLFYIFKYLFKYYTLRVYLCATLKHLKDKKVKETPDQHNTHATTMLCFSKFTEILSTL